MRVLSTISLLAAGLAVLTACGEPPPFAGITSVKVRHIGESGLKETVFEGKKQQAIQACLYSSVEVPEEATLRDLLQTTYLIEVSDSNGDRSFELYTQKNLKGNKGRYYVNDCIYKMIMDEK